MDPPEVGEGRKSVVLASETELEGERSSKVGIGQLNVWNQKGRRGASIAGSKSEEK